MIRQAMKMENWRKEQVVAEGRGGKKRHKYVKATKGLVKEISSDRGVVVNANNTSIINFKTLSMYLLK